MTLGKYSKVPKPIFVSGVDVYRNIAERCPGDQTNNRAELIVSKPILQRTYMGAHNIYQAIARVLEELPASITKLVIKTDSNYSIGCKFYHQRFVYHACSLTIMTIG